MVAKLPEGPEWSYEIKLDGYRAQALSETSGVQLLSRNGKDLGKRFPEVVAALARAIPHGSIVDGELVALDATGKPSFSLIQNSATSGATFVFLPSIYWLSPEQISLASHFRNGKRYCRKR